MQWFNWILRGGRIDVLPDFFLDLPGLRELFPLPEQARRALVEMLTAGPFSERELRNLDGQQIERYVRCLVAARRDHGLNWIRENPLRLRVMTLSPHEPVRSVRADDTACGENPEPLVPTHRLERPLQGRC